MQHSRVSKLKVEGRQQWPSEFRLGARRLQRLSSILCIYREHLAQSSDYINFGNEVWAASLLLTGEGQKQNLQFGDNW